MCRIAEQKVARLRTLEVKVRGVLPGEPHTAVDLNIFCGRVVKRLAAK
jgi:hypothetical protein